MRRVVLIVVLLVVAGTVASVPWWLTDRHKTAQELTLYGNVDLRQVELAFNNSDHLRTPLCIALADEDENWRWMRTLEAAPGEFSYPTLVQTNDGLIHMVYTHRRTHIHYARFSEDWLLTPYG